MELEKQKQKFFSSHVSAAFFVPIPKNFEFCGKLREVILELCLK
jgi:hypothetical protein